MEFNYLEKVTGTSDMCRDGIMWAVNSVNICVKGGGKLATFVPKVTEIKDFFIICRISPLYSPFNKQLGFRT